MPGDQRPVRLGIIGCGRGARVHHLPALAHLREFEVAALADPDAQRLHATARESGVLLAVPDYRALLSEGNVEAIAVATPPANHAAIALAAVRAGKHVLIEKPLALTLGECDQLITEAAHSGLKILVAHNARWHRLVRRARAMIRSGALGELKGIRSVYTHWNPGETAPSWHGRRSLGGGVLINDGVHHFDLWRYLLDTDIVRVQAESRASGAFEDDTCSVSAALANGAVASALFSFSTSANSELEIFGTQGRLLLSLYRFDGLEFHSHAEYPGNVGSRLRSVGNTLKSLPYALADRLHGGTFNNTYRGMWRHFAACIRGDALPECTLQDGRAALQAALAADGLRS